jgi:hypothetical protein
VTGPGTKPAQGTPVTVQIQTKPLTFYRVQVGAYSTKENADKTVQAIAQKGMGAAVMAPDPLYKVYCGLCGTKEAAEKLAATAQSKLAGSVIGKDDKPYVSASTLAAESFAVRGDKAVLDKVQGAFAKADNAIASLLSFWDSLYTGGENKVDLTAMETDITAVRDDLSKTAPPEALKAAHAGALKIVSDLAAAVKTAKEAAGGDSGKAGPAASAFVKSVDTYIQELKKLSP